MEIWDRGCCELVEAKGDGGLTVRLHGSRIDGTWALVPAKLDGNEANWLVLCKESARTPSRSAYRPTLATSADTPPGGDDWLHEIKWDGYRVLGVLEDGAPAMLSRGGGDYTDRFRRLAGRVASGRSTRSARGPRHVIG